MRIFCTKAFRRFLQAEMIGPDRLFAALDDLEKGQGGSDLGGGVYKQRIPRRGGGKSGGYRVIVLLKIGRRAVFVYGYTKSVRANIGVKDLVAFRALADVLLYAGEEEIKAALQNRTIFELNAEPGHGNKNGKK